MTSHRDLEDAYVVVGFVGDYRGGSNSIDFYRPVVKRNSPGDQFFVPEVERWSESSLVEISPIEEQYVNFLPKITQFIAEGDGVLIAGAGFYNTCARLPGLEAYGTSIQTRWEVMGGAFSFRVGSRMEFDEVVHGVWNHGVQRLYESLFSPEAKLIGIAADYFRVLQQLTGVSLSDSWRSFGLYYKEVRNLTAYDLLRHTCVAMGEVASVSAFDEAVDADIDWLRATRLSENRDSMAHLSFRAPAPHPTHTHYWSNIRYGTTGVIGDPDLRRRFMELNQRVREIQLSNDVSSSEEKVHE